MRMAAGPMWVIAQRPRHRTVLQEKVFSDLGDASASRKRKIRISDCIGVGGCVARPGQKHRRTRAVSWMWCSAMQTCTACRNCSINARKQAVHAIGDVTRSVEKSKKFDRHATAKRRKAPTDVVHQRKAAPKYRNYRIKIPHTRRGSLAPVR